ncbi:hypothetical protein JRQ81_000340 [Phrynocephalus forsythii]|uniref:Receptor-type tyrosine-protein phosphatase eta n=1 Tax=Phrynocephalus forsythii TaxID=171643 RepID=A0A9Q0Y531_9SAUR|nr:hypothetical protein JRQ81_000340 [Phrynocephalus forsythii]
MPTIVSTIAVLQCPEMSQRHLAAVEKRMLEQMMVSGLPSVIYNAKYQKHCDALDPMSTIVKKHSYGNSTCCKAITTKPTPVSDIQVESISTTTVNLTWKNYDLHASNYTYLIQIEGNESVRNKSSDSTSAGISSLEPGTLYTFNIYPVAPDSKTVGEPNNTSLYTKPTTVSDIQVESISTTTVNLTWKNYDLHASNYTYLIQIKGNQSVRNKSSDSTSARISSLEPGTLYTFSICPVVPDSKTVGEPNNISLYTKPTPVSDIQVESISTTTVNLTWKNYDLHASNYTYLIQIEGNESVRNKSSDSISAGISSLEPGTLYTFNIYPVAPDSKTVGEPNNVSLYTKPTPVSNIRVESISTTTVNLTWKNYDLHASNYTYLIQIKGNQSVRNKSSDSTSARISSLEPGTLYTFNIYPVAPDNKTVGEPNNISLYTRPSPVFDIRIENITPTTLVLKWNCSDPNASKYTYTIVIEDGFSRNISSVATSTFISNLDPGTLYTFTVYAVAADNKTIGEPNNTTVYTKPNPVFNIHPDGISTTTVNLMWQNDDKNAPSYTYLIEVDGNDSVSFNTTHALFTHLEPGTSYTFKVFPVAADNKTVGEPNETTVFTIPSPVFNISITNITTTVVHLIWKNLDSASPEYSYRIYVNGSADMNMMSPVTSATISGLSPGTRYTFSIYSIAGDNKTEGNPSSIDDCTIPASVNELECKPVSKQAELLLSWTPPQSGAFDDFRLVVLNSPWNATISEEFNITVTNLNYFTDYTLQVVTRSCKKESIPREISCRTSITDPPPPSDPPAVKARNHYSLNVQFSVFNSTYGPITAYAIVVTTSEAISSDPLRYTYDEFIKKKTDTYVASVLQVQQKRSSSSDNQQYNIEVGDGSYVNGYVNGKLDPLGSYRACVAGFTQIDWNDTIGLINLEKSFVSLSPLSGTVVLPPNPDVIIGAVVGCVLAAVIVAAIAGFIFWKRRRNGGKNSDAPFDLTETKSMKVEVENFESYFKKQKADSNCGFAEEYEKLRKVGINQPKFAAELPENKSKNRYNNVLPYEFSRVKLLIQNHPADDYINASYMPGYKSKEEFIAAQGPLPTTVEDFWRLIWEKNIYTVVMLTKCIEQGRTKCEEYWPNKQSKSYGDITVAMTSEIALPEWTIRDFSMTKSDSSEIHPVRQFHFTAWPDHGVLETTDLLISFRHLVQEYMKLHRTSPTLVHCSAGVGRTGTFIALDRLIHQMEMENIVDVYGVVYDLRMHRSLMVQTEDQYVFLNQCVLDIIKSKKEKKTDLIYQNTDAMAIYENFTPPAHTGKANGYHV